jgi:hypothetical protein
MSAVQPSHLAIALSLEKYFIADARFLAPLQDFLLTYDQK